MSFVREMLSETGKVSTTRTLLFIVVFTVMFVYTCQTLRGAEVPLPQSLDFILPLIMMLMSGKVIQKGMETKANSNGVKPEEGK